jgi:hypothetical protein
MSASACVPPARAPQESPTNAALPPDLAARLQRHISGVAADGLAPRWAHARVTRVYPVEKAGVSGSAYYEAALRDEAGPAGYVLLASGEHDVPVAQFAVDGEDPAEQLLAKNPGARRIVRVGVELWAERADRTMVSLEGEEGAADEVLGQATLPVALQTTLAAHARAAWQRDGVIAPLGGLPDPSPATRAYCPTPGDVPTYHQMWPHQSFNDSYYKSGCGATAWAMLIGWVSQRAYDPWASNWSGFGMIYRLNGVANDAIVSRAPDSNDPEVEYVTWDLRNRLHTTPGSYGNGVWHGATLPSDMDNVEGYLKAVGIGSDRMGVSSYHIGGAHTDAIRDRAIQNLCRDQAPTIIGIGDLSHYAVAEAYYETQDGHPYFWANMGELTPKRTALDASIFYAGTFVPKKAPPGIHIGAAWCADSPDDFTENLMGLCEAHKTCLVQPAKLVSTCSGALTVTYRCGDSPSVQRAMPEGNKMALRCGDGYGRREY